VNLRLADLGFLGCWFAAGVDEREVVVDLRLRARGGGRREGWRRRLAAKVSGVLVSFFSLSFLFFFRT